MITLVTSLGLGGWELYGSKTIPKMRDLWPADRFLLYAEIGHVPKEVSGWEMRWTETIPGYNSYCARCSASPIYSGRRPHPDHKWKRKELDNGYAYKWDAAKFGKMAICFGDAARRADDGILIWLDADVMSHNPVPKPILEKQLRENSDVAYLGRERIHSETGIVLFRIPEGRKIGETWGDLYLSDEVFSLPEWHAAYIFDIAVKRYAKAPYNMTSSGQRHVWFQGPFRKYADHLKGVRRKNDGMSHEWILEKKRRTA